MFPRFPKYPKYSNKRIVYNLLGEIIETLEVLDDKELMDEIRKTEEDIVILFRCKYTSKNAFS